MTELGTRGRLGLPSHVAQLRGLVAGQFPEEGKAWPGRIELRQIPLFHALLGARIIVLTSLDADQYFFQALKAGASGFLLKDVTETELTHSIRGGRRRSADGRRRSSRRSPTVAPTGRSASNFIWQLPQ